MTPVSFQTMPLLCQGKQLIIRLHHERTKEKLLCLFPVAEILCSIILITAAAEEDEGSLRRVSRTNGGNVLEARYKYELVNLLFALRFFSSLHSCTYTFHLCREPALNFQRDLIHRSQLDSLQRLMKILLFRFVCLPTSHWARMKLQFSLSLRTIGSLTFASDRER